jgi:hypothetical protein
MLNVLALAGFLTLTPGADGPRVCLNSTAGPLDDTLQEMFESGRSYTAGACRWRVVEFPRGSGRRMLGFGEHDSLPR